MPTLEDAIALAMKAHLGQKDKAGEPYILHPLRVMFRLGWDAPEAAKIAAVLHDVVEDSKGKGTFADLLRLGYVEEGIDAGRLPPRLPGEAEGRFNERLFT